MSLFNENMIWIQNAAWGNWPHPSKDYVLTNHLQEVVADLQNAGIKYALPFIGMWNPATNDIDYELTDAQITTMINAFHVAGINVLAWVMAFDKPMDISAANRQNLYNSIIRLMNKGFDGLNEDIEVWTTGSFASDLIQDWLDYINGLMPLLHGMGKLATVCAPMDWRQNINPNLICDFIVSMFYSSQSTFENIQAEAFYQEEFGQYNGHNTPPASPVIMGLMNYWGNQYPLAWQLNKFGEFMEKYPYSKQYLAGAAIWLYEYMWTSPSDWLEWTFWESHLASGIIPAAKALAVESIPADALLTYEGRQYYAPFTQHLFSGGKIVASAPAVMDVESHSVLIGTTDHKGAIGYSAYTYTAGPYTLPTPTLVSELLFYAKVAGNAKLAIYSTTTYPYGEWGEERHPYQLLSKSAVTHCEVGWNLMSLQSPIALPAGDYFFAVKTDSSQMIGTEQWISQSPNWWHGQFITHGYGLDFPDVFPTIEGLMGMNASIYVPTEPLAITPYYFDRWSLDYVNTVTNPITVTMDADHSLIAYFVATPTPPNLTPIIIGGLILGGAVLSQGAKGRRG